MKPLFRTEIDGDVCVPVHQGEQFKNMQLYNLPASKVVDIGVKVPDRVVDNLEMASMVTGPDKLKNRLPRLIHGVTGTKSRVYAEPGTSPSDLAVAAAYDVLNRSGIDLKDIDTLIFASTDMDTLEPATANIVQQKLGIQIINAFDVTNACNSFLQAMNVANSLIASRAARRILIVSGEIGSYVCNRELEHISELDVKMGGLTLGDGGAAMIMEQSNDHFGIQEINLMSVGEHWELCHVPETTDWRSRAGGIHGWFYLDMPALAKIARRLSVSYFEEYNRIRKNYHGENHFLEGLDHVVPHQISRRFIEEIVKALNVDMTKVCVTADLYGNTASTAIPMALRHLIDTGKLEIGGGQDTLLYGAASGFGIGHIRIRF